MCEHHVDGFLHSLASRKCTSATDAARAILRNGENVNAQYNGQTALHVAARSDNLEMVQLLLHFGADLNALDDYGSQAFEVAKGSSKEFILKLVTMPAKKRKTFLGRIFAWTSGTFLNRFLRSTRKKLPRFNSVPFLKRESPLPKDRHDPHPSNMVVENDPLPLEDCVLPGTPQRPRTPSLSSTPNVTVKRGGRPKTKMLPKATVHRMRSHSADDVLQIYSCKTSSTKLKKAKGPSGAARKGKKDTAPKATVLPPQAPVVLSWPTGRSPGPPIIMPKPKPSAPPLNLAYSPNTSSDAYVTAEDSLHGIDIDFGALHINAALSAEISNLTDSQLRGRLARVGISAGPITPENRKAYEKRLLRFQDDDIVVSPKSTKTTRKKKFSEALCDALDGNVCEAAAKLDKILLRELNDGSRQFNYLLLDGRKLKGEVTMTKFVASIFYVGKGTSERPMAHLVEAKAGRNITLRKPSEKHAVINTIWDSGHGVVQLELGKGAGAHLALTREACLISAIKLENLTNVKSGEIHGAAKHWTASNREAYGTLLIVRAYRVYVADPPRPVSLENVPDQLYGTKKKH